MSQQTLPGHITRKWIRLALRVLGITLASVVALIVLADHISRAALDIERARAERASFHAKYESFDRLKADRARVEPHLTKLETAIPAVDSFPVVSDYLASAVAKTSNTATVRFDSVPSFRGGALGELGFSLQLNGSLFTITDLLRELESAPYFISVRSVSISFAQGAQGQAEAALSGVLYLKESSP